jgi:pimeloyl-ACP methyl ester carboxylesterase
MKHLFHVAAFLLLTLPLTAQRADYPHPVSYHHFAIEGQEVKMAYMDVKPVSGNGRVVLLFHGKNFNGYYWKDVIKFLSASGFRVIVPDQLGFGKSDKPNIHYSFSLLAANTYQILDSLKIKKVIVVGHSMGGMLAARFALMYPSTVEKLIFENPIGLEDYRLFVPCKSIDQQFGQEIKSDFNSLKNYQQSYYPEWKPEYKQYVTAQFEAMQIPDKRTAAWASALTYDMIYQQPVVYEFKNISQPTLIIIGQSDRTIVGKKLVPKEIVGLHGLYPELGKLFHEQVKNSKLVELEGIGHIPHVQDLERFKKEVLGFLK